MKKKITLLAAPLLALLFMAAPAQAHIVGLGWTVNGNNVTFDALHWHGNLTSPGQGGTPGTIIVDGTTYNFTSITNDAATMTGLDGALTDPIYSSYNPGSGPNTGTGILTALSVNDWMHVTVTLAPGAHTVTAPNHPTGLTNWRLAGGVTTIGIVVPPTSVPEPSTLALLGLGLVGAVALRRRKLA